MKNIKTLFTFLLICQTAFGQIVIFRDAIPNASNTTFAATSTINWFRRFTDNDNTTTNSSAGTFVSSFLGKGSTVSINCGTATPYDTPRDVGYLSTGGVSTKHQFHTTKFTLDRSVYRLTQVSFYIGHDVTTYTTWVGFMVGGIWYCYGAGVAQTVTGVTDANFNTTGQLMTISINEGANWRPLTLTGTGVAMTLGSYQTLPEGNIEGFCFLIDKNRALGSPIGTGLRLDTPEIMVVEKNSNSGAWLSVF